MTLSPPYYNIQGPKANLFFEKFEKIFDAYCGNNKLESFHMQYLAYWVEPVIIENDEDICVA